MGESSEEEGASEGGDAQTNGLRGEEQNGAQEAAREEEGATSRVKRQRSGEKEGEPVKRGGSCCQGRCGTGVQKPVEGPGMGGESKVPEAKREKEEEGRDVAVQA